MRGIFNLNAMGLAATLGFLTSAAWAHDPNQAEIIPAIIGTVAAVLFVPRPSVPGAAINLASFAALFAVGAYVFNEGFYNRAIDPMLENIPFLNKFV